MRSSRIDPMPGEPRRHSTRKSGNAESDWRIKTVHAADDDEARPAAASGDFQRTRRGADNERFRSTVDLKVKTGGCGKAARRNSDGYSVRSGRNRAPGSQCKQTGAGFRTRAQRCSHALGQARQGWSGRPCGQFRTSMIGNSQGESPFPLDCYLSWMSCISLHLPSCFSSVRPAFSFTSTPG